MTSAGSVHALHQCCPTAQALLLFSPTVNFMGMPTEGYGFSNDPKVMRKPTFDEAKFDLGANGAAITIHLR